MSRSLWKGFFLANSLYKTPPNNKQNLKIWSRNSTIPFSLINSYVLIHNGNTFKRIFINREKVGYKFGSFSFTRKLKNKNVHKKK